MFLRFNRHFKDGKEHRYWNIVEDQRCAGGKVVQRQVPYLGEINDGERAAWCQLIEAFDDGSGRTPPACAVSCRSRCVTGWQCWIAALTTVLPSHKEVPLQQTLRI